MLLFDSMMFSGLRWVLSAIGEAAAAELDDDAPLRAALLDAGVRLELGEISEQEFARIEEGILSRIGEIRARREAGAGPIAWREPAAGERPEVEASIVGEFHDAPAQALPAVPARPRARPAKVRPRARPARRKG